MRALFLLLLCLLPACASVVATAGSGMAGNLTSAIMNQDDPELVRDGAPAYLLMLDSFVEGAPGNESALAAAAARPLEARPGDRIRLAPPAHRAGPRLPKPRSSTSV